MLSVLFICCRNRKILKPYQDAYLVISVIIWFFICISYFGRIILLIMGAIGIRVLDKFNQGRKGLKFIWIATNGCAFLIMFIGFIYDIIILTYKSEIGSCAYLIIYFGVCFVYIIFTIIDYYYIEDISTLIVSIKQDIENGNPEPSKKKGE